MSNLLNALEQDVLEAFFRLPAAQSFVLTGGAALAEFYFQHRRSNDLDLFTLDEPAFAEVNAQTKLLAAQVGAQEKPVRSLPTLNQVVFARGAETIKIDFVRDSGPMFGQPLLHGLWRIDALENLGTNKVLALFCRAADRDYVDLYLILRERGLSFVQLLAHAKEKDLGLQEFYLANWIRQQTPKLQLPPNMLRTIDTQTLKAYFLQLADDLMAGLNPERNAGI